jgi:hypothetical protein
MMTTDFNTLAKDWSLLVDLDQFTLVEISLFGDLFLKDSTGAYCLLDINFGELQYAETVGSDPEILFPIAFDMVIATDYIKGGLLPVDGQCFGYKEQLVSGGSLRIENVYIAILSDYVSFMGDYHNQIKDVADGETVQIKAINHKIIP